MVGRQRRVRTLAVVLSALMLPAMATQANATSAPPPSVRLVSGSDTAVVHLYRNGRYDINFSIYVAATGGSFELWRQRASYDDPVTLSQVVRDAGGTITDTLPLPGLPESDESGRLPAFLTTELTKRNGTPIKDVSRAFCPNDWQGQRVDDSGPSTPTFPFFCWTSPFTRGMVLGIDQGWSTQARPSLGQHLRVDPGTYQLTVSIAEPYRTAFGVAPEDVAVTVPVSVVKGSTGLVTVRKANDATRTSEPPTERASAPIGTPPDSALPDIEALPAWGIRVENRPKSGRAYLNFGATAWNAGPGPLVVEGFRDPASPTMNAFQYFYENGEPVNKLPAGTLAYDNRDGHQHWHFKDFAAYSLLDSSMVKVVDSGKEAFCLAPTDAIDITVTGAEWRPWFTDLSSACGDESALWIREVLATGWGDTYAQYRPGQSFEITDLPNGTYYIRVLANPDNVLLEGSSANNEALRMVKIHGKPDQRWVEVPPYGLIDTEGGDCGPFC